LWGRQSCLQPAFSRLDPLKSGSAAWIGCATSAESQLSEIRTDTTLAYRAERALAGAPAQFAALPGAVRTPGEILAHMGDLLDWALSMADGAPKWRDSAPIPWDRGIERFFTAIEALDQRLAPGGPLAAPAEKLFQGTIADALTHVGQIAMLRRLAGFPQHGENYYEADIAVGRVGLDQAPARVVF
jgi:hypothetical protein